MTAYIEPITGRYVHVELNGVTYRTSYEEAGQGIPLVCLHTAGADLRQYRHLLNDSEITDRFRVIAFDMPRHGRSLPPDGTYDDKYVLSRRFYIDFIAAFSSALDLDRPVVLGTSMGGYIILDIAVEEPGAYRGLIAVQPRAFADNWTGFNFLLDNPAVNIHSFSTVIKSLISPLSPHDRSREVEWVYNQAGPGVLAGDFGLGEDHDVRETMKQIDPAQANLFVVGGDWDVSCLPAHTDELAAAIEGLPVTRMPETGHFPPAEHPEAFRAALFPVLAEMESRL